MSRVVDERVVSMQFDNKHFEQNVATSMSTIDKLKRSLNFTGASKGLENINSTAKGMSFSGLSNAVETVKLRFSALEVMAVTALTNITNSAVNAGKKFVSAFTIDPIKTGFSEYETQINAVQTILANTQSKGTTLDDVNAALDELNTYADKTIYNFTEMTRNIGTFTAAGTDLETSVNAIQGIANLAAISGSTSQQASTAMYQLSQALASGTVKLMDWNSVEHAGMGGQVFQDALKETARVHGIAIDDIIEKNGSFRESLHEGWLTADILTETLMKFTMTTEGLTEAQIEQNRAMLKGMGYSDEQIEGIFKLGQTATDAATKVKTFTHLMDALKEVAQSGWTQTWELLIGDFEEAKELWTSASDVLGGFINSSAESRNTILKGALVSNWDQMIEKIAKAGVQTDKFEEKVKAVAKDHGHDIDALIKEYGSLEEVFRSGAVSSDVLKEALGGISKSMADLTKVKRELKFDSVGEDVKQVQQALRDLGYDLGHKGVDGIVGEYTDAAIKAFQQAQGLEVTGVVDKETLTALEKASGKVDGLAESCSGLIDEIDKLGGRDLIIKSVKNIFNGLLSVAKPIKAAFNDIFHTDDLEKQSKKLYKFIENIENLTSKFILSEESGDKLRRTFKGLFAIIDIITTVVGGGFKAAFKVLAKLLGAVDLDILSVTASIGDAIVKFRDWLFEGNRIAKGFNKVISVIGKFVLKVRDFIKSFLELPEVQANLKKFKMVFSSIGETLKNRFKGAGKVFKDFIERVKTLDGFSLENIKTALKDFWKNVIGYFINTDTGTIFDGLVNAMRNLRDNAKKFLEGAGVKFDEIGNKISNFVVKIKNWFGDNMGGIIAVASLAGLLFFIKKLKDAVELFVSPLSMFESLFDNFGDAIKRISKSISFKLKAEAIKSLATAVGIIAASIVALTLVDKDRLWSAVGAIGAIVGALVILMVALSFLTKSMSKLENVGDMAKLGSVLLSLSATLLLVAIAVKIVGGLDWGALGKAGAVILAFGVLVVALSKFGGSLDANITKFGITMIALSGALMLMGISIGILGKMDRETLIQGGIAVGAFLASMVVMMAATRLLAKDLPKFGSMMIGLGAALLLMSASIGILGRMNPETLRQGMNAVWEFMGMIALMMAASRLLKKDLPSFGMCMTGISFGLLAMSLAIGILGNMNQETLSKGTKAMWEFMGMVAVMMLATKLLGKNASSAGKFGLMILSFSASLLLLVGAIAALSLINPDDVDNGVKAIGKVALIFAGLMVVSAIAKNVDKGPLITMSIAIGILAISVAALSLIDPERLSGATKAMSTLMIVFGILVAASSFAKKSALAIGLMAGVILILGGVLYVLSTLPIESTQSTATSLSALLLSLSSAMLAVSFVPITGALSGIASLAIFIAGVGVIMAAIAGLAKLFPGMESFLNESIPILGSIGYAIGSFVGSIVGGFLGGASSGFPEIGTNLATFMTNLTPFIDGIKSLDATAVEGAKALASMILAVTGARLLDSITTWLTGGSSLEDFGNQLVPFGRAMSSFSSIVSGSVNEEAVTAAANAGKIMAEMANTLPNSGGVVGFFAGENDMATFAAGLVPFGNAITSFSSIVAGNVNEEAVLAAANAGKMMAEMAKTLPNSGGVVGWFMGENDMGTFAAGLVPFGNAIVSFSSIVAGNINEEAVLAAANAGKMMAEMANALPNSGGVISWFAGDNDMATFGSQLILFGFAIKSFSTQVSGIDESAITAAANAGTMLATMASAIPTTGGIWSIFAGDNDMATFGLQLVCFGKAMKNFSTEVAGIDAEAVTVAATAGETLAGLANTLPESGGIWSIFTADNDMSTFATQIKKYGKGISSFSEEVAGIDVAAVTTATSVTGSLVAMANLIAVGDGANKLETFGSSIESIGEDIASFATKVVDVDASTFTSIATGLKTLASIKIDNADAIKSFVDSLGDISSKGIDKFVSAFKDGTPKVLASVHTMIQLTAQAIRNKGESLKTAFKDITSACVTAIKSNGLYAQLSAAGKWLVQGFANGIALNTYIATQKARLMAEAAKQAVRNALAINSPSKVFSAIGEAVPSGFAMGFANGIALNTRVATQKVTSMAKAATLAARKALAINSPSKVFRAIGKSVPEGFAMGIDTFGYMVKDSATSMADTAIAGTSKAISRVVDTINSDIDAQPTIRPVLDLSEVTAGANGINSLFNMHPSVGVMSNISAINSMMGKNQNGGNHDIISAIKDLGRSMDNKTGDTYNFGGITYDDGSNVNNAVRDLVRAIKMEARN